MYTFRLSRSLNYALPIYITEGDSPSLALRIAHMPDIGWTPTPLDRTRAALGPVPHWQMVNAPQQFKAQCAADRVCLRQPQFQPLAQFVAVADLLDFQSMYGFAKTEADRKSTRLNYSN